MLCVRAVPAGLISIIAFIHVAGLPAVVATTQLRSVIDASALYAAAGTELTHYDVQVDPPALLKRGAVDLPGNVQYAWPHPSGRFLYVAWSNGPPDQPHGLSTLAIDEQSGALAPLGMAVALRARSIHLTTDVDGTHVLVAYNAPSGVTVHALAGDGTVADEVVQPADLDRGVYAHQVRVHPSNRSVILVTRGNVAEAGKAEDPGALKIYDYRNGVLTNRASIAPAGGFGFQPRHVDFHPSGKWLFVSLEPQNTLQVFRELGGGLLGDRPIFTKASLPAPPVHREGLYQRSGTVHTHPNGRFIYQANRATDTADGPGTGAWGSGTNAIAVFSIDATTGEPALIQNAETHGIVPRTFSLDSTGRILVAANQNRHEMRGAAESDTLPSSLALFRVLPNGKLDYQRKYDVETRGNATLFWMGIVARSR